MTINYLKSMLQLALSGAMWLFFNKCKWFEFLNYFFPQTNEIRIYN
jgi:hypothetical protein